MDNLFPVMLDRNNGNTVWIELASDVLFTLLDNARGLLMKEFKRSILDVFMANVRIFDKKFINFYNLIY
jgi:hypothetical protein